MTVDPAILTALQRVQADQANLTAHVADLAAAINATPPPPPPPPDKPDWVGSVGPTGSPIPSSLYPFQSFVAGHVSVVTDPKGSGKNVIAFAVNNSDAPYPGSVPRGDIYSSFQFTPGMDKWFSLPMLTPPAGLPGNMVNNRFLLISQLAIPGGDNQPNLTFSVSGEGVVGGQPDGKPHWSMYMRSPYGGQVWIGPPIDDSWHTLIVHVVCESSASATDGSVELWYDGVKQTLFNGRQVLSGVRILEVSNDGASHSAKLGLDSYRSRDLIAGTYTLFHGVPKIGKSYASVA